MKGDLFTFVPQNRNHMIESLPKHAVCAELGVFEGDFSGEIAHRCKPSRLFLVDLFRGSIESGDVNGNNMHWANMEEMPSRLRYRFLQFPVTVVQSDSVSWLQGLQKGFLDWVYIDTSHVYDHTLAELLAAADAVKQGGFICGHDFNAQAFPGVVQAVSHFCLRFGMKCEVWHGDALASFKIENSKRGLSDYVTRDESTRTEVAD